MDDLKEIVALAAQGMEEAIEHLEKELASFRVGKANPKAFDNLLVDYYGSQTPIPQVSSVTAPDARTIYIQPWEKSMLHIIEKAIIDANMGVTPQNNGEHVIINVPPLTEERRKDLVKQARNEGEHAKISIRNSRRDGIEMLKAAQKNGLSEDLEKDGEDSIQEETDKANKKVEDILAAKEIEILTV
ncbi:MAG: ribosome recycling factor [Bacteroidales bacterium]